MVEEGGERKQRGNKRTQFVKTKEQGKKVKKKNNEEMREVGV